MKKNLLFYPLTAIIVLLVGCSGNNNDEYPLKGTKWEYKWDDSHDQYIDVETYTLTFNKTDFTLKFQAEYYEDGKIVKETESKTGTYTYDHPKVVLRSDGETETLTRSGNKLISDEEEDIIFTKK